MTNSGKQLSREDLLEEIEARIEKNKEKHEKYSGKSDRKAEWFNGIATGYQGAKELIENGE
ncbi:MAG: hypothetical protein ABEI52_12420 [Halobacteriaceae archaeon]